MLCKCGKPLTGEQKIWCSGKCADKFYRDKNKKEGVRHCQCGRAGCHLILTGKASQKYATSACSQYARYQKESRHFFVPDKPRDVYVSRDGDKIRQPSEAYTRIISTPGANYAENQKRKTLEMRDAHRYE